MQQAAPSPRTPIHFPPFEVDLRAGLLRRDGSPLNVRPKTYAVLLYLVENAGKLVTKQALLDAIWTGVAVSEDVVRVSVGELRKALGDDRATPRFIETVPRRGYRFIARMGVAPASRAELRDHASSGSPQADDAVVGRVRERARIAESLRVARGGRRQVAFISGEAGIGKSTLVDVALRELQRASSEECGELRIARGQCIEHFGGGEPYLPVLDALAALCRGPGGETVQAALGEHAPDWVLRALGPTVSGSGKSAATTASTHEHTLHQLAASLDALAAATPLVLVLEDVQWSDYATLDLLSVIAQRREPARLLVLCTLRPADAIVRGHPVAGVKRELVRKGLCHEILLDGLASADVATYLAARLAGTPPPERLLSLVVDTTEGNPFFIATLVDHLLEQELLVKGDQRWEIRGSVDALRTAIPEGSRAVIEPRLGRLTLDELSVFEAASVVGPEFAAHAVARIAPAASDLADVEVVEQLCDGLVHRQGILRASGETTWPDGTTSARYAFRHALYQQVAYQRIRPSTCRRLHQAVGEGLEAAYAGNTIEVASALAAHFERSRDLERAIRYHAEAARHAESRLAYQETRIHLQAALDLLASLPESAARLQEQMALLHRLGWTLATLNGWGDENALRAFTRMRELAERHAMPAMRLLAMESLRGLHVVLAEYASCRTLSEETMALAEQLGNSVATGTAHADLAAALIHLGEFESAHDHAERALALVDRSNVYGISALLILAPTCTQFGLVARSRALCDEALASAAKSGIPYYSAFAGTYAAACAQSLDDVARTRTLAAEALRLASECGFSMPRIKSAMLLGWCVVEEGRPEEGRAAVRAAFMELAASRERTSTTTWHALLARAHLACGDAANAHEVLDAAFAFMAKTGERIFEHELHRLRGDCLLVGATTRGEKARAAEHYARAIAIAVASKSPLFELRAASSLLRLRGKPARDRVVRLLERFDAANDCADARVARALLAG